MANPVGSVTAEIILDTKQFEESVKKLKGEVEDIKESFNKSTGNKGLSEEVKKLKEEIESLRSKTDSYKKTISDLREQNEDYAKGIRNLNDLLEKSKKEHTEFNKELKKEQSTLDNVTKSAKKYAQQAKKVEQSFKIPEGKANKKYFRDITNDLYGQLSVAGSPKQRDLKKIYKQFEDYYKYLMPSFTDYSNQGSAKREFKQWFRAALDEMNAVVKSVNPKKGVRFADGLFDTLDTSKLKKPFQELNSEISKNKQQIESWKNSASQSFKVTSSEIKNASQAFRNMDSILISTGKAYTELNSMTQQVIPNTVMVEKAFVGATKGAEQYRERISVLSKQLKEYSLANEQYYASVGAMSTKYWNQIRNSSVSNPKNWKTGEAFQQSAFNVKTVGMQDYYGNVNKINQTLENQVRITREAKLATDGLSQAYRKTNLNTYKANLNQINKTLEQQRLRTAQLEAAQASIYYKNAPNNLNTYKMNMDKINQSLEKQTGIHRRNNQQIRTGQMSMREFGTTMGKAEAYSNNLYRGLQKVRSVIVSMKTIMGAMGGMAVWNFAFGLIEKAKETYNAKNEMESILNKNSKVNAEGVQVFNKALDDTVARFQKINKYTLGETAAGIGLEFELNAKEMAKSLDVIAMVQNEYIRAGRTSEEAALAVKDILQGEFMRLSRETGVGKDDLIEKYGWNGKTEDVQDLMKALEKAGKSRHWDLFAEKATSVNDVLTITQNRFGEFGADLMTHAEPMIVGAFNGILSAVDSLKTGFQNMGTFEKYLTVGATGGGAFMAITTGLMMFKRNMGLAQIATLGWGKSFATALLGLNKTDVAMHGFLKTLTATISGTKASSLANVGLGKSLAARLLGVKANIAGEEGFLKAIMVSQGALRGESEIMTLTSASGLTLSQRLAAVTRNLSATEVQGMKTSTAIRKIVTSTKLLRIALLGIGTVAIAGAFASVAQYTDAIKKRMETYKDILANGKQDLKDANDDLKNYQSQLDKLNKNDAKYNLTKQNRDTVQNHINDLNASLKLAKQIKKTDKEVTKAHDTTFQGLLDKTYAKNGVEIEKYGQTYLQMRQAAYDMQHAEDERYKFLYASSQHINEQVALMKEAKVSEEDRVKYITEYSTKAQEAAENLKKFNQGDINAGVYYLINRAQLMWIDLWNNQHFIKFWQGVQKTWEEVKPSVMAMKDTLISIGEGLADFFSTDFGRWIGLIGVFGAGIGTVALKIGKWVTGSDSVFQVLKKVGGKLKDVATGWKKVGDNADVANKKTGGTMSTGGIAGDTTTPSKVPFKDTLKNDAKNYARAAIGIAASMALITEAIILLKAPMWGLSEVGKDFKAQEPQIRDGIEGLKLIAPILMILLPPVIALSYVFEKFGVEASTIARGAFKAAVGIAAGMLLVAEAVVMMNAPLLAIASVGHTFTWQKNAVLKGKEALQLVTDCLVSLAPTIPIFIAGIALMAVVFAAPEIGLPVLAATALGIGAGMLLVAEAIIALNVPLAAIAQTGQNFTDLSAVRQGAEAIKLTAEALKFVSDAMVFMTVIDLNLLAQNIDKIVSAWLGVDLTSNMDSLTQEGGVLDQLSGFVTKFNSNDFTIETINQDKVTALAGAGDGIKTIGDAMQKVSTAMDSLPDEFKNSNSVSTNSLTNYDMKTNTYGSTAKGDTSTNYFDQFKEPLEQLKQFIYDFNHSDAFNIEPIDTTRVDNISSAASMIESVKQAVDKVKATMQGIGQAGHETAYATGGSLMAFGYDLFHMTGAGAINNGQSSGSYKSSLGSQLQQMEDVIDDLFTFQSNISSKGTAEGEGANVSGLATMVTQIQDAISKLSQSLSDAVPTFEGKGNAISSALSNGIKTGLNNLGGDITTKVSTAIDAAKPTAETYGKGLGWKVKNGFQSELKIKDVLSTEVDNALNAIGEGKAQEFYDKGKALGDAFARGFKDGSGIHSPGYAAQSMQSEISYIGQYITDGITNLPNLASQLGNLISSNFTPQLNLGNLQFPDISQWTSQLGSIPSMVNNVKTQVATGFTGMSTNVGTSLQGIATNARAKYSQIVASTRTSLTNMQSATTKNIGNIKSSWRGMQNALIASAEHIKTQTGSKIDQLKTNLGNFWNKLKHPDQLIGAAGGHIGSIRRRSAPHIRMPVAGGFDFKPRRSNGSPDDLTEEYFKCLSTGNACYAGGWNFNWKQKIQDKFNGWNTHFGKWNLDNYLRVGKFNNDNFPVNKLGTAARASIAKQYIFDTIAATNYGSYFNSHFGDDPVAALRAGVFNCWDGTNIILAIARAFGFSGGMGHGTWNGIGHVWADIPGLGIIDPTAIQQRGTFTSSAVKGYGAGSISRSKARNELPETKTVHNYGDTVVNINAPVYGVDDLEQAIENGVNKAKRKLLRKSLSGV